VIFLISPGARTSRSFRLTRPERRLRCCTTCRTSTGGSSASFQLLTEPTPLPAKAFRLLGL